MVGRLLMVSVSQFVMNTRLAESISGSHYITTDESDKEGNMIEENIVDEFNQEEISSYTDEFDEEYL